MTAAHPRLADRLRDDAGAALVLVIGMSFIATLLVVVALGAATGDLPAARHFQDSQAAINVAQAGVEDLVYRLDRDQAYMTRRDATNAAMTGWAPLPGSGQDGAEYHYSLDTSQSITQGFTDIISTGRVNGVERTVRARVRRRGFLDQVYLTDYEVLAGLAYFDEGDEELAFYDHHCRRHRDQEWTDTQVFFAGTSREFGPLGARTGRLTRAQAEAHYVSRGVSLTTARSWVRGSSHLYCGDIAFSSGDIIQGPLHSNDGIAMRHHPRFLGQVTTAYRRGDAVTRPEDLWVDIDGNGHPQFAEGIESVDGLELPPTNDQIRRYAANGGCVYQGPTYIHVHTHTGQPRMTVVSPQTSDTSGAGCGPGRNLALPPNGVVYVENAAVSCSDHPLEMDTLGSRTTYTCNAGDAFVWGELDGQMTIAAERDIRVVSDLTYVGDVVSGDDVMGLIANDFVWVHHPVRDNGTTLGADIPVRTNPPFVTSDFTESHPPTYPDGADTWNDPVIQAAIVALDNSFIVEDWGHGSPRNGVTRGDRHDLTVIGSISQAVRGPVATGYGNGTLRSGYEKDYVYDDRLHSLSPPFFIEPVQAAFAARAFSEIDEPPTCGPTEDPLDSDCLPA